MNDQPPVNTLRPLRWLEAIALGLLVLVLIVYLLEKFATVLQQLLVAVLLAYLILPLHHALVRRRVPHLLSVILILGGTIATFSFLGTLLYNSIEEMTRKLPEYQKNLARIVRDLTEHIPGVDAKDLEQTILHAHPEVGSNLRMLRAALGNVVGFLSSAVVVLVYLLFLLGESAAVGQRFEKAFGPERTPNILAVVARINASISQYLIVKTTMGVAAGVFTAVLLLLFGVDYALLWGVLAFLLNYIPYLGSLVAVALPVVLSLVQSVPGTEQPDLGRTLVILVALLVMQNGIGYVIEPRLAGRRLDLSPLVIIVSLAFWGSLWGIVGMILAVPLMVVCKTVMENIPTTRPIAALLSNV